VTRKSARRVWQDAFVDSFGEARYAELDFNAPMSAARARDLIATIGPLNSAAVVDLGCGWAELLLRILEQEPTANAVGIDRDPELIARAQTNADSRKVHDRVRLECADVTQWAGTSDVAIVIGSSHAWGGTSDTLNAVHDLLSPGGRLLLGECIWEQPPTPPALAALDAQPDDFTDLPGLVDLCLGCGYQLLALSTATLNEWDSFESRYCAGRERWLLQNLQAPNAHAVRTEIDAHRNGWLRGYRGILGFAYLTLAAVPH
jgi:cyclopropane fatty-acyl-phospholipid synthase-like methyltransferase